jgi:hypothetical protein
MLTEIQNAIVGCAISEKILKDAKGQIDPGLYLVDALVRIQGTLSKGEDFQMKAAAKIDWRLLASLALSKVNNETQDAVIDAFIKAIDGADGEKDALTEKVKERVEAKIELVKGNAPMVNAKGRVTAKLVAEIVGDARIEHKPDIK